MTCRARGSATNGIRRYLSVSAHKQPALREPYVELAPDEQDATIRLRHVLLIVEPLGNEEQLEVA